jgi:hypothetical protein
MLTIEAGDFEEIDDERRPYAPAANVVGVLERVRKVNLPDVVDSDLLRIAGVSEGAMTRVVYALRFLRLTDANGRPTDRLRAIAKAPEEEWRDLLAGVVREAYATDFARLDPGNDPQPRIVSAFKRYEPRSQTERMVMLFLGLCRAGGIPVLDAPRERGQQLVRMTGPTARSRGILASRAQVSRPTVVSTTSVTDQLGPIQSANLLFGVTIEDIGALDQTEFTSVWNALGMIARARASSLKAAKEMADMAAARREKEAAEEGE